MKTLLLAILMLSGGLWLGARTAAQEPAPAPPPSVEAFAWSGLLAEARERGRPYLPFLERPTLSCGLYRLAAGAVDAQTPHELDEVYYVARGRARLEAGGEARPVAAGDVLFVAAGQPHRFVEIEQDLELLVLFSKAPPPASDER